jgi:hypothetical protein
MKLRILLGLLVFLTHGLFYHQAGWNQNARLGGVFASSSRRVKITTVPLGRLASAPATTVRHSTEIATRMSDVRRRDANHLWRARVERRCLLRAGERC